MRYILSVIFCFLLVSCNQEKEKHFTISRIKDRGVFSFKNNQDSTLVYSDFVVEIKNMSANDITEASGYVIRLDEFPQFGSFLQIELAKKKEIVEYKCVFQEDISFRKPWRSGGVRTLKYDLTELGDSFSYSYPMLKDYIIKRAELYIAIECSNELLDYSFSDIVGVVNITDDLKTFIANQSKM